MLTCAYMCLCVPVCVCLCVPVCVHECDCEFLHTVVYLACLFSFFLFHVITQQEYVGIEAQSGSYRAAKSFFTTALIRTDSYTPGWSNEFLFALTNKLQLAHITEEISPSTCSRVSVLILTMCTLSYLCSLLFVLIAVCAHTCL